MPRAWVLACVMFAAVSANAQQPEPPPYLRIGTVEVVGNVATLTGGIRYERGGLTFEAETAIADSGLRNLQVTGSPIVGMIQRPGEDGVRFVCTRLSIDDLTGQVEIEGPVVLTVGDNTLRAPSLSISRPIPPE